MVGGLRYGQLAAARSPAPAPLPAADAPAAGAAHDPAAHGSGLRAAEERTASCKWTSHSYTWNEAKQSCSCMRYLCA